MTIPYISSHDNDEPPEHTNGTHGTYTMLPAPYQGWKTEKPMHQPSWHDKEPNYVHSLQFELDGIKHMTVIRADDIDDLWKKVRTVAEMVKAARARTAKESPPTPNQPSSSPLPARSDDQGQGKPATDPASCPLHGTRFLKPSKYGGCYCATKGEDGSWCSYKVKGGAA